MRRSAFTALVCAGLVLASQVLFAPAAAAVTSVFGFGSSYVGPAMDDWKGAAKTKGLPVDYTPTNSPDGIGRYGLRTADFGGTEAEVSSLEAAGVGGQPTRERGFQYVPDVAGATAVMYNVSDASGRHVDYLHLNAGTIGRIFSGDITRWSDPAITATNGGKPLPDQPIRLVVRSGNSGTTALFYDYIAHAAPGPYATFMQRSGMGKFLPDTRPINLEGAGIAGYNMQFLANSSQIAEFIGGQQWTIGYDEFAYAKLYGVQSVWVQNASGNWVQPYAENIAAALRGAHLRPDLSQELSGVYANGDPKTYPISAYSYVMAPCNPAPDRDTCRSGYTEQGKTETMSGFLDHIACQGQLNMAAIGFSPLPPNLSQEMMNSVSRLTGQPPKQLNAGNCANPTFHGGLGAGSSSPPDPFIALGGVDKLTKGGNGGESKKDTTGGPAASSSSQNAGVATASATGDNDEDLANGGSKDWRAAEPAAYDSGGFGGFGAWAALVLFVAIITPLVVRGIARRVSRR
ncbi:substrate-binding domain-containing protein [Amycolatopsis minnesotensis]|uniref:Substrate-binding domain-containing protein n=1 Tax=Amycolatopsis minnesotensis TaxID=337894 RepID=A0ABP5CWE6_9PSEU